MGDSINYYRLETEFLYDGNGNKVKVISKCGKYYFDKDGKKIPTFCEDDYTEYHYNLINQLTSISYRVKNIFLYESDTNFYYDLKGKITLITFSEEFSKRQLYYYFIY